MTKILGRAGAGMLAVLAPLLLAPTDAAHSTPVSEPTVAPPPSTTPATTPTASSTPDCAGIVQTKSGTASSGGEFDWEEESGVDVGVPVWSQVSFSASDIAVGTNGTVWYIGSDGSSIYQMTGASPKKIEGAGSRVAVDPSGNAWIVNSTGAIFKWTGASWTQVDGTAKDVAVGANGTVWILGADGVPSRWDGAKWVKGTGRGTAISVDPKGNPWVTNESSEIWQYTGSTWKLLPGAGSDIAVGADGTAFAVGNGGQVWRLGAGGNTWERICGAIAARVAAGRAGVAYAARSGAPALRSVSH